jgi:hypothetical protein
LICYLLAPQSASAQILPPPPHTFSWDSLYSIPGILGTVSYAPDELCEALADKCEEDNAKHGGDGLVREILQDELHPEVKNYCTRLNRTYFETDIFGRFCLVEERYRPNYPVPFKNPDGKLNCPGIRAWCEALNASASMAGSSCSVTMSGPKCRETISRTCFDSGFVWDYDQLVETETSLQLEKIE